MSEKVMLFIFYLEIIAVLVFLLFGLFNRKEKSWYKKSPLFYDISYILIWSSLIIILAFAYPNFFMSDMEKDMLFSSSSLVGKVTGIFLYLLFLLAALGITFAGIKSIKEKKSITPGPSEFLHRGVRGEAAMIYGIFYLIVGLAFLFGVLKVGVVIFLN